MAIKYNINDTTPQLKYARMVRRKKRVIQLHNILGLWRQFNSNRWYIVKLNLPHGIGDGWRGSNTYHLDKVRKNGVASYATKAEADTVFATLTNQTNKAVGQFGLTQAMYNSLPANAQNRYAFSKRLSAADWDDARLWTRTKRKRIVDELLLQEALVENDSTGDNDTDDV